MQKKKTFNFNLFSRLLIYVQYESKALERFILDKCAQSIHLALQVNFQKLNYYYYKLIDKIKVFWLLSAEVSNPEAQLKCEDLKKKCFKAVANVKQQEFEYSKSSSAENVSDSENSSLTRRSTSMSNVIDIQSLNLNPEGKERIDYFQKVKIFIIIKKIL